VAPTTKPIPDAYRRVTPCLIVQGGAKALELTTPPNRPSSNNASP
jgi:hypothetical protein